MPIPTVRGNLQSLWQKEFFKSKRTLEEIAGELSSSGFNPTRSAISHALDRAEFITKSGKPSHYKFIQKFAATPVDILTDVLPDALIKTLGKKFKNEIDDLNLNYGRSGTCTAFLLRKILEKLIYLTFAKNQETQKLINQRGELVGLQAMLTIASINSVRGKPYLMQKTANAIKGIKFLGDTAAHNPVVTVSMKTIRPEMPFIITAYQELADNL
jgi:hypothetical protein